ncbi:MULTISPECIES: response regulator [Novosphingobium]|uniref:response regulator n=1 Tax=Novosphingobium TaxID=165696 RepID=UPI001CD1ACE9|nr:response regulator [Novosphingobium percolationis]MCH7629416.1 response regulator [Pseudomonadota bacterium]
MPKTILIVDDSPTMIMSVRATLEMNGYRVEAASDGARALAALNGGLRPDLIITDINMPNMGGLDFIRNARSLAGCRFTPILTLTTESERAKRDESRRLGATGWLVKPISGPDLLGVIRQVLPLAA